MKTLSKMQSAKELLALERQWSATCQKNRAVEGAFSVVGILFFLMFANLVYSPPAQALTLYLSVWFGSLAILVLMLPLLLLGAWREWRIFRRMAALGNGRNSTPKAGWKAHWELVVDFVRSERA